jgi:hypothetical protein
MRYNQQVVIATLNGNFDFEVVSFLNPYTNNIVNMDLKQFEILDKSIVGQKIFAQDYAFQNGVHLSNTFLVNQTFVVNQDNCRNFFNVSFENVSNLLLKRKETSYKPKAIEDFDMWMIQYRTTYTSEYSSRIFTKYSTAKDFWHQSKAEMIADAREHSEYEVCEDSDTELCIEYDDRYQCISIEGIEVSDNENEEQRSFFS